MKFNSLMHVSFFTDQLEEIRTFYEKKLGLKPKTIVRYGSYKGSTHPMFAQRSITNPDDICIIYIEVAPGQFIEFFPKKDGQQALDPAIQHLGYTHIVLTVDDIYQAREELIAAGITLDKDISIGASGTYKLWIHDPDGNKIEIMQYTEQSLQVKGNC